MSNCSTPKKRRIMSSWSSLIVSKIPANLKMDDIDYVNILDDMEDIEAFQKNKLMGKRLFLQDAFGDSPDLIEEILKLMDCVSLKSASIHIFYLSLIDEFLLSW